MVNVTFWWCKWTVHKDIYFTIFIKTYVFVISDNIQPVNLPLATDGTFLGVWATVSGFGHTTESKWIAPFNLQSKIKIVSYTVGATWIWLKFHKISNLKQYTDTYLMKFQCGPSYVINSTNLIYNFTVTYSLLMMKISTNFLHYFPNFSRHYTVIHCQKFIKFSVEGCVNQHFVLEVFSLLR
jgi:hypothetical protein